jgi:hypothetical protein
MSVRSLQCAQLTLCDACDVSRLLVAETSDSGEVKGSDADAAELLVRPAPNVIDFGPVFINEKVNTAEKHMHLSF